MKSVSSGQKLRGIALYTTIATFLVVILSSKKVLGQDEFLGRETRGGQNLWLEMIVFGLFLVILIQNYTLYKKLGNSIVTVPFIYILGGLIIMIFARFFTVFYELNIYEISSMIRGIWWHLFFYLGIIVFYLAIRKVEARIKEKELSKFSRSDLLVLLIALIICMGIFLTPSAMGSSVMETIGGTFVMEWGLIHFIAFVLIGLLSLQMITIQTQETQLGTYMDTLTPSFLVFLTILTLNHLFALLTRTWELLEFEAEIINTVEQILWVLAFLVMGYGYNNLNNSITSSIDISEVSIEEIDNPTLDRVMVVLTDHIGALAENISQKSAKDSGIELSKLNESNIKQFADAIEQNTTDLIGKFPSRFLNQAIQNSVKSN